MDDLHLQKRKIINICKLCSFETSSKVDAVLQILPSGIDLTKSKHTCCLTTDDDDSLKSIKPHIN